MCKVVKLKPYSSMERQDYELGYDLAKHFKFKNDKDNHYPKGSSKFDGAQQYINEVKGK